MPTLLEENLGKSRSKYDGTEALYKSLAGAVLLNLALLCSIHLLQN